MKNPTNQPRQRRIMSNVTLSYYDNARKLMSERMKSTDGIGDRLRALRECTDPMSKLPHALTKTQVSEFLGITHSNIGRYEDYPKSPTSTRIGIDALIFLSTLYGVPMEYVMYGTLPSYSKIEAPIGVEEAKMPYADPNAGKTAKDIKTPIGKKLGRNPTKKQIESAKKKEDDLLLKMESMKQMMADLSEEMSKLKKG